ncbi:hypothetical protein FOCC_FOCC008476 [Frankliniella occidentalis]|nr:hypothetical protein FOCC_FOCC008476 [Frankliniella occidentalis]
MNRFALLVFFVTIVALMVVTSAKENPGDIYNKKVWPAVLNLRAKDPAHWYDKLPALYANLKKQYGSAWSEIMKHGTSHVATLDG